MTISNKQNIIEPTKHCVFLHAALKTFKKKKKQLTPVIHRVASLNTEKEQPPLRITFEVTGIANIGTIPPEILMNIFSYLPPQKTINSEEIFQGGDLRNVAQVSVGWNQLTMEPKRKWINEKNISLSAVGCKTATDAVDYIIQHRLTSANLLGFPNLNDLHLKRLFTNSTEDRCRIKHLSIQSKHITSLPGNCLNSLKILNFLNCFNLETLPDSFPNLRYLLCECSLITHPPIFSPKLKVLVITNCHNVTKIEGNFPLLEFFLCKRTGIPKDQLLPVPQSCKVMH